MTLNRRVRRGYSLAEVLIASALAGVVLAGALDGMGLTAQTWLAASDADDAQMLAHELLFEILAQSYFDPDFDNVDVPAWGVDAGESPGNRSTFDDLDDYDDWSSSPPRKRSGGVLNSHTGWTRSVVVRKLKKRKVNDFRSDSQSDHESRQITVTVADPQGESYVVEAIRARLGAVEQPIGVTTEFVTAASVTLQTSDGEFCTAARLVNHAEGP